VNESVVKRISEHLESLEPQAPVEVDNSYALNHKRNLFAATEKALGEAQEVFEQERKRLVARLKIGEEGQSVDIHRNVIARTRKQLEHQYAQLAEDRKQLEQDNLLGHYPEWTPELGDKVLTFMEGAGLSEAEAQGYLSMHENILAVVKAMETDSPIPEPITFKPDTNWGVPVRSDQDREALMDLKIEKYQRLL